MSAGRHLVLGATGQVGGAILRHLAERGIPAVGTGFQRAAEITVDLGDPAALHSLLDAIRPGVVFLTGAYTHVDGCEADPARSRRVNFEGPAAVSAWAAAHGATVVFYSTDYVFDGQSGPYAEGDPVHPLSRYGADKRAAEEAVLALGARGLVLRTAWVYSWETTPKNFMQRLALNLAAGQTARVPDDQWGNPTYAPELARATLDLLDAGLSGLIHAAGSRIMTRFSFASLIADSFGLAADQVVGVSTASLAQAAPRPLHAGMLVDRLAEVLGWVPRPPEVVLPELAHAHPLA